MKRILSILICFLSFLLLLAPNLWAWNDKVTHKDLSKIAAQKSNLEKYVTNNLGVKDGLNTKFPSNSETSILYWLREGSKLEDSPMCRTSNHFHNPLLPWDQSYVTDDPWWLNLDIICAFQKPFYSSVTWGTGYLSPSPNGTKITISKQEWGWDNARNYYYQALTSSSNTERETYFAKTFQALGQVLHLIEDGAQPGQEETV